MSGHAMGWLLVGLLLLWQPVQAQTAVVEYIHTDAQGSVVAVTDASRNVVERREYEPYGLQLAPAVQDGPGYTGHVQDAVTGLTYMQQRYYEPQLGVFLSVDPVTAYSSPIGQFHRYRYASSSPYRFIDPDGRAIDDPERMPRDTRSITAKCLSCIVQMQTSAKGSSANGSKQANSEGRANIAPIESNPPSTVSDTAQGEGNTGWGASSILTGDTTLTATGVAAMGIGIKGEKISGPGNDKISLTTPALGLSATGTVNLLTVGYRWSNQSMPADVSVGGGGIRGGYGIAGGISLIFDPGGVSVQISGGVGAGASLDIFGVGYKPGGGR